MARKSVKINARLTEETAGKLKAIVRSTGSNMSEAVAKAIDSYYHDHVSVRSRPWDVLSANDFPGCSEGPSDLSSSYKDFLGKALKVKHDNS